MASAAEAAADADRLTVAISSRALFDLAESHALFESDGLEAYRGFQMARENDVLEPGIAFPLVHKLLRLNDPRAGSRRASKSSCCRAIPPIPACASSIRSSTTSSTSRAPRSPAASRPRRTSHPFGARSVPVRESGRRGQRAQGRHRGGDDSAVESRAIARAISCASPSTATR